MYHSYKPLTGLGSYDYCKPQYASTCFDTIDLKRQASQNCTTGVKPNKPLPGCTRQGRLDSKTVLEYDPCDVEQYPVCSETLQQARDRINSEAAAREAQAIQMTKNMAADDDDDSFLPENIYEDELLPSTIYAASTASVKEDDNSSYKTMGIIAALVVGGGAVYLMTRKKKKSR